MKASSLIHAIVQPRPGTRSPAARIPLQVGEVLQGKIIEHQHGGRVLVDFGKLRALADIRFAVLPGQMLRVEVVELGEQVKLKRLPPLSMPDDRDATLPGPRDLRTQEIVRRISGVIDDLLLRQRKLPQDAGLPEAVRKAFEMVRSFFHPLEPHRGVQHLAVRLEQLVKSSGLFLEKQIERALFDERSSEPAGLRSPPTSPPETAAVIRKDLKANLLRLKAFFDQRLPGNDPAVEKSVEWLKSAFARLLFDIREQQLTAAAQRREHDLFPLIAHLFHLKPGASRAFLLLEPDRDSEIKQRSPHRLSILLCMDRMGDVRIDFEEISGQMSVVFRVVDRKVQDWIEENLGEIKAPLGRLFGSLSLGVRRSDGLVSAEEAAAMKIFDARTVSISA